MVEGVLAGQLALRGHELVAAAAAVGGLVHPVGHRCLFGLAHLLGIAHGQRLLGVAASVDLLAQRGEPAGRAGGREPRAAARFGLGGDRRQPAPAVVAGEGGDAGGSRGGDTRSDGAGLGRGVAGSPGGRLAAQQVRGEVAAGEQARGCAPCAGQRGPAPAAGGAARR